MSHSARFRRLSLVAVATAAALLSGSANAQDLRAVEVEPTKANVSKVASLIVEKTNAFRKAQELDAVQTDPKLTKTAQAFAEWMAQTDKYGHQADGRTPSQRAKSQGYEFCLVLENIAWQYSSTGFETKDLATRFETGWEESPGHRKNMLNENATQTGVGVALSQESQKYYAVQLFGRPASARYQFQVVNPTNVSLMYRVDDETYTLKPNVVRTHTRCLPATVTYPGSVSADNSAPAPKTKSLQVEPNTRYKLVREGETLSVTADGEVKSPPQQDRPAE